MSDCDLPWCERARWRNCSRCGTWPPGDKRNPPTQPEPVPTLLADPLDRLMGDSA